jgi:hypothetical protein
MTHQTAHTQLMNSTRLLEWANASFPSSPIIPINQPDTKFVTGGTGNGLTESYHDFIVDVNNYCFYS